MARLDINSIQRIDKERNSIHGKVHATISIFEIAGRKFVQIDTYGNSDREMPEKISQSFQIDEESAVFLVKLLSREFDMSFGIFGE